MACRHPALGSLSDVNPLLWVVLASVVLSGFFSLIGYAIRTFRRVPLERAFAGPGGRQRIALFGKHLTALRLTASFCRALFNLVLVVSMLYLFGVPEQGWRAAVWVTGLTGGIIAVFGVAIPHAWASSGGEKVLAATLSILMGFRYSLYPVIWVMQGFDVMARRLSGTVEPPDRGQDLAKREILEAASEGQAEGAVGADAVRMIELVMGFSESQAGQIMTPRTDIFAVSVDTPLPEAARQVAQSGHSRVPVYEGRLDNIIGVLYAKDLLQHVAGPGPAELREAIRKPFFVPATKPLSELLREFRSRGVHLAVVLDEYGGTAGLVSIEDVLEEIVGEIADEYDAPSPSATRKVAEGVFEVDGRMRVGELNRALGLKIREGPDYDTIAGFLLSELGYIPSAGERLQAHGARFTVQSADERRITKVRLELMKEAPP
jgi:putative hemolysin